MSFAGKRENKTKWRHLFIVLLAVLLVASACSVAFKEPDEEQIKVDLLSTEMPVRGQWFSAWKFEALSEFQKLTINSKEKLGQAIEYDVSMRLQSLRTKKEYLADVVIVYKKQKGKWEIVSVSDKLWQEIQ